MGFGRSDAQQQLQEMVCGFVAKECSQTRVREIFERRFRAMVEILPGFIELHHYRPEISGVLPRCDP
jgi:hypothetical protein